MATACTYSTELELITPKSKGAEDDDEHSDDPLRNIGKTRIMMRVIDLTI